MTNRYAYQLLNVFTRDGAPFSGNPLCVFEDGSGLDAATMQPPRSLGCSDQPLTLEMPAGVIAVASSQRRWTLRANVARHREIGLTHAQLATALGLCVDDVLWLPSGARPLWLDTGTEQLMVPLSSKAAVGRAAPRMSSFENCVSTQGRRMAYVFAAAGPEDVESRFFFEADGVFREDPATGSACANLGGWYQAVGAAMPLARRISQGVQVHRPSWLYLTVDARGAIHAGGDVITLGKGSVEL